jgi:hypothetical protein
LLIDAGVVLCLAKVSSHLARAELARVEPAKGMTALADVYRAPVKEEIAGKETGCNVGFVTPCHNCDILPV